MTRNSGRKASSADNDDRDESDADEAAHEPPSHEGPVYPLLPDAVLGSIDYLVVHRVVETGDKPNTKPRSIAWPKRFNPLTTDEITIAEECGGGIYDVFGRNAKGHIVAGDRFEVFGEPKQPPGATVAATAQAGAAQPSTSLAGQHPQQHQPQFGQFGQFAQQAPQPLQPQDPIQQTASGAMAIRGADPNTNAVLAMLQAQAQQQAEQQRLDRERQTEQARLDRERWEKLEEQRRLDREEERKKDSEREERRRQDTEARLKEERDRAERETVRVREDADRRAKEQQANSDRMMNMFIEASKPQPQNNSLMDMMLANEKRRTDDLERRLDEQRRTEDQRRKEDDQRRKEDLAAAKSAREAAEKSQDKREERAEKKTETDNIMGTVEKIVLGVAAMPAIQAKLGEALGPAVAEVLKPVAQSVIASVMNEMANAQQPAPALPSPAPTPAPAYPDPSAYPMPGTDGALNGAGSSADNGVLS